MCNKCAETRRLHNIFKQDAVDAVKCDVVNRLDTQLTQLKSALVAMQKGKIAIADWVVSDVITDLETLSKHLGKGK